IEHDDVAGRGQTDARLDPNRLAAGEREAAHLESRDDAGAARPGHVGLTLANIILVAGQIGAGQEAAVEKMRGPAEAREDRRPDAALVLQILAREHLAALRPREPGDLGGVGNVDGETGRGLFEL